MANNYLQKDIRRIPLTETKIYPLIHINFICRYTFNGSRDTTLEQRFCSRFLQEEQGLISYVEKLPRIVGDF